MEIGEQLAQAALRLSAICDAAIPKLREKDLLWRMQLILSIMRGLTMNNTCYKWGNRGGHTLAAWHEPWALGHGANRCSFRRHWSRSIVLAD